MNLKKMVQTAVPGWNGLLAAHHVSYLADGNIHRAVPYIATNPSVIEQKLALMQLAGIDLVISTWQGAEAPSSNLDATLMCEMCSSVGLQFCLLLDPWAAKLGGSNLTENVANSLNAASTQKMLSSPAYILPKYVLDFNTGADLTTLTQQFPSLTFLPQDVGFSWPSINMGVVDPLERNATTVAALKICHAMKTMKIASFCMNFNDSGMPTPQGVSAEKWTGSRDYSQSVWGGAARVLESYAGDFMLEQLATILPSTPIIALVTWDDYDEQSSGPYEKVLAEQLGVSWDLILEDAILSRSDGYR